VCVSTARHAHLLYERDASGAFTAASRAKAAGIQALNAMLQHDRRSVAAGAAGARRDKDADDAAANATAAAAELAKYKAAAAAARCAARGGVPLSSTWGASLNRIRTYNLVVNSQPL
jgi:hypothetical protein